MPGQSAKITAEVDPIGNARPPKALSRPRWCHARPAVPATKLWPAKYLSSRECPSTRSVQLQKPPSIFPIEYCVLDSNTPPTHPKAIDPKSNSKTGRTGLSPKGCQIIHILQTACEQPEVDETHKFHSLPAVKGDKEDPNLLSAGAWRVCIHWMQLYQG